MSKLFSVAFGLLLLLGVIAGIGWVMWRWLKNSDDPARLVFKWILTALVLGGLIGFMSWVGFSEAGAFTVPFACVFAGVILSAIWAPHVGALLARPLTAMFDGGNEAPEPTPAYSVAQARRKNGKYQEALYEIQQQLARFPRDFTGQMLMAEIQAENLHDLAGAQNTVERFCAQPGHAPQNVWFALNQVADWHLKYAQDTEAARRMLEKIIGLLPETEQARQAIQRLAHLGSSEQLVAARAREPIALKEGLQNVGLLKNYTRPERPEDAPEAQARAAIEQLEQHPEDAEAREQLAVIYADSYQRFDLAAEQLDLLIHLPHQPAKQIVRWLNMLADVHVKAGDEIAAREVLERIVEAYSGLAASYNAQQRLAHLSLRLRAKEKSQDVELGIYEQNIGLKRRRASQRDPT